MRPGIVVFQNPDGGDGVCFLKHLFFEPPAITVSLRNVCLYYKKPYVTVASLQEGYHTLGLHITASYRNCIT
jgi:hypothetical protein